MSRVHTRAASSGAAALDLVDQEAPDAVIVDYAMPEMNGVEFIRELRERNPTLPVVLTSGLEDAESTGSAPLLRKPFRITELDEALAAVIEEPPC
ncbi:MAG: response regulator [Alphaproteobacteria bacterium]|nr:response regulator [Alphaproteobacteria bacterium]